MNCPLVCPVKRPHELADKFRDVIGKFSSQSFSKCVSLRHDHTLKRLMVRSHSLGHRPIWREFMAFDPFQVYPDEHIDGGFLEQECSYTQKPANVIHNIGPRKLNI
jgi:hypothetical protein